MEQAPAPQTQSLNPPQSNMTHSNHANEPLPAEPVLHFVTEPPEELYCQICTNLMQKPHMCPQGHSFCHQCIIDWLGHSARRTGHCPIDRIPLPVDKLIHNIAIEGIIARLQVYCTRKADGCTWQGDSTSLIHHVDTTCTFHETACTNQGCNVKLPSCKLASHLVSECELRQQPCTYCNQNVIARDLEQHFHECPDFPIPCTQGCATMVSRSAMHKHTDDECENSLVPCPFSPLGCNIDFLQRSTLPQHLTDCQGLHMGLLVDSLRETRKQGDNNVEILFKPQFQALAEKWQSSLDHSLAEQSKIYQDKTDQLKRNIFESLKPFVTNIRKQVQNVCEKAAADVKKDGMDEYKSKLDNMTTEFGNEMKKNERNFQQALQKAKSDFSNSLEEHIQCHANTVKIQLETFMHTRTAQNKQEILQKMDSRFVTELGVLKQENRDIQLSRTNVIQKHITDQCDRVRKEMQSMAADFEASNNETANQLLELKAQVDLQDHAHPTHCVCQPDAMVTRKEYDDMCKDYQKQLETISSTLKHMKSLLRIHMQQQEQNAKTHIQAEVQKLWEAEKRSRDEAHQSLAATKRQRTSLHYPQEQQDKNPMFLSDSEMGIHD